MWECPSFLAQVRKDSVLPRPFPCDSSAKLTSVTSFSLASLGSSHFLFVIKYSSLKTFITVILWRHSFFFHECYEHRPLESIIAKLRKRQSRNGISRAVCPQVRFFGKKLFPMEPIRFQGQTEGGFFSGDRSSNAECNSYSDRWWTRTTNTPLYIFENEEERIYSCKNYFSHF